MAGRGSRQGHELRIAVGLDLGADRGCGRGQVRRRAGHGVAGPFDDERGGIKAVQRGRDREAGAAREPAHGRVLTRPADRGQHGPGMRLPARRQLVLAACSEARFQDGAGAVQQQVGAGEPAGIAPDQRRIGRVHRGG